MKGRNLLQRSRFAFGGLCHALRREASFRTELLAAALVGVSIAVLRPPMVWTALLVVMVALVLAVELLNTAIEEVLDGLHPDRADFVKHAKDCAAAAVLVLSAAAVLVFLLMLLDVFGLPSFFRT